jgi:hypothetical protein
MLDDAVPTAKMPNLRLGQQCQYEKRLALFVRVEVKN